jgi:hypothetical protein
MRDGSERMNKLAGSRRMRRHAVIEPGKPGHFVLGDALVTTKNPLA